ncbi:MAG: DUF4013 domain-containing protein [Flavobacteriaceae bacterium]|jgi:uncharacterized membrane protein YhaH (DUF805 family)|nr:DUF4013 domain-containing protein [Flavobacteriaceae bacterium]
MIQFYKKRDFGEMISDTFQFLKLHGKNYFKNYFLINGILLILMIVIVMIGYYEFFQQFGGSNLDGETYLFEEYFQDNELTLILVLTVSFILMLAALIINYLYPVLYMKRISETGNTNIKSDEILGDIKKNIGKFFIFFLGATFIVTPIAAVLFGISVVLVLIIIGIFLLLLMVPVMANVVNFLLFDYFHTDRGGFFSSLSYAIRSQFSYSNGRLRSPFWKYWGSWIITYMIVQIVLSIFSFIPYIILMASVFTTVEAETDYNENPFGAMGIMFYVVYGIYMLIAFTLMNIIYINAGFMYYDSRLDLHRNQDITEIDSIGKNEEIN